MLVNRALITVMNAAHQLVSRSVKPDKKAETADRKAVQKKGKTHGLYILKIAKENVSVWLVINMFNVLQ